MNCKHCDKEFAKISNNQRYCSNTCSKLRQKMQKTRYYKSWKQTHDGLTATKKARFAYNSRERYNGHAEDIYKLFDNCCAICKRSNHLNIHHIDGRGLYSKCPNNKITNLVLLCHWCHRKIHKEEMNKCFVHFVERH
jgi:hypothetical protein